MAEFELSRVVDISEIRENRYLSLEITATIGECKALSQRYNILEINDLTAFVKLCMGNLPSLIIVEGDFLAHVVQACSVTLDPVPETVEEKFNELLTTDAALLTPEEEEEGDSSKPVDLIEGDRIDVGEIVAQWLGLSLNPYPRSEAPLFQHIEEEAGMEGKKTYTPFKVLESLKKDKKA